MLVPLEELVKLATLGLGRFQGLTVYCNVTEGTPLGVCVCEARGLTESVDVLVEDAVDAEDAVDIEDIVGMDVVVLVAVAVDVLLAIPVSDAVEDEVDTEDEVDFEDADAVALGKGEAEGEGGSVYADSPRYVHPPGAVTAS